MLTTKDITEANNRGAKVRATTPHATAARYDRKAQRIILTLSSRIELMFTPSDAQGLEEATPAQLSTIEISPSGYGIHFPKLDADIYLPALLEGVLGSRTGWPPASEQKAAKPAPRQEPPHPAPTALWADAPARRHKPELG